MRSRQSETLRGRSSAWACLLLACSACERERLPPSVAPSASAGVKRAAASAVPHAPRAKPNAVDDLLRQSDVQVTVSSFRDRKSVGEFLADGRADTAWRPNPPDPAPWVGVLVPAAARVQEVRLALEASPLLEELSVQVSRDGEAWGRAEKGAAGLGFSAPVGKGGGTFRVTFQRSGGAAGRLVAVTSLTFGGEALGPLSEATPAVTVKGGRNLLGEPFVSWWSGAPYSTREALCERYHELRSAMPSQRSGVDAGAPTASNCSVAETLKPQGTAPHGIQAAHVVEVDWGAEDEVSGAMRPSLLVFESEHGFRPADFVLQEGYGAVDSRASVAYVSLVTKAEWRGERLVLQHLHRRVISGGYGDDAVSAATLTAISCAGFTGVPKGGVFCERALIAYGDAEAQGSMLMLSMDAKVLWAPPHVWLWQRDAELSTSGRFRASPCRPGGQAKGKAVPCYATLLP